MYLKESRIRVRKCENISYHALYNPIRVERFLRGPAQGRRHVCFNQMQRVDWNYSKLQIRFKMVDWRLERRDLGTQAF